MRLGCLLCEIIVVIRLGCLVVVISVVVVFASVLKSLTDSWFSIGLVMTVLSILMMWLVSSWTLKMCW